jgi:hypothetical protein
MSKIRELLNHAEHCTKRHALLSNMECAGCGSLSKKLGLMTGKDGVFCLRCLQKAGVETCDYISWGEVSNATT